MPGAGWDEEQGGIAVQLMRLNRPGEHIRPDQVFAHLASDRGTRPRGDSRPAAVWSEPRPRAREDQELVAALRRGEAGAVEDLVDRYGAWIYRLARRLLSDPRDAEEVTQDVLLAVAQKIAIF